MTTDRIGARAALREIKKQADLALDNLSLALHPNADVPEVLRGRVIEIERLLLGVRSAGGLGKGEVRHDLDCDE